MMSRKGSGVNYANFICSLKRTVNWTTTIYEQVSFDRGDASFEKNGKLWIDATTEKSIQRPEWEIMHSCKNFFTTTSLRNAANIRGSLPVAAQCTSATSPHMYSRMHNSHHPYHITHWKDTPRSQVSFLFRHTQKHLQSKQLALHKQQCYTTSQFNKLTSSKNQ